MSSSREQLGERIDAWIIWYSEIRRPGPLGWIGVAAVLLVVGGILLPVGGCGESREHVQASNEVHMIRTAVRAYQTDYGSLPTGNHASVVRALLGDNPRKIPYLELRRGQPDSAGEIIDPWGTPYRIDLSDLDDPRVYSLGKNKRDELNSANSDDIRSWQ